MSNATYLKIELVINAARRPLAAHEFKDVSIGFQWGDKYVGQSESTIGRRMREMVTLGRLTSNRRAGKNFKEFALVKAVVPVEA